jgi:REP element-mobilizing transposase RayT
VAKTVGYMITWTTYGTWLQGDERRYVKNGKIRLPNRGLTEANRKAQLQDAVLLTKAQQNVVRGAIVQQAKTQGHRIRALAVNATHVHVVAEYANQPISKMVPYYKKPARLALKTMGHTGKLWTTGYDKRFCFDRAALDQRTEYVKKHEK